MQTNQNSLYARQKKEARDQRQREPYKGVNPGFRGVCSLDKQNTGNDEVADDENCEIRWSIVSAVVIQLFAAIGAPVCNFEIGAVYRSGSAGRAAMSGAAQHSVGN